MKLIFLWSTLIWLCLWKIIWEIQRTGVRLLIRVLICIQWGRGNKRLIWIVVILLLFVLLLSIISRCVKIIWLITDWHWSNNWKQVRYRYSMRIVSLIVSRFLLLWRSISIWSRKRICLELLWRALNFVLNLSFGLTHMRISILSNKRWIWGVVIKNWRLLHLECICLTFFKWDRRGKIVTHFFMDMKSLWIPLAI